MPETRGDWAMGDVNIDEVFLVEVRDVRARQLPLEDVLKLPAYKDTAADGMNIVRRKTVDGHTVSPVHEVTQEFRAARFKIKSQGSETMDGFHIFQFTVLHGGAHICWDIACIASLLNLLSIAESGSNYLHHYIEA